MAHTKLLLLFGVLMNLNLTILLACSVLKLGLRIRASVVQLHGKVVSLRMRAAVNHRMALP